MDSGPLATVIRDQVAADAELRLLLDEARRRRLPQLAVVRLRPLRPADFTPAALAALGEPTPAPVWTAGITNPWAAWLQKSIRWRLAQILTGLFDQLRDRRLTATGMLLSGERIAMPNGVWSSTSVTYDLVADVLGSAGSIMFSDVEIQPPAPAATASRSALDRFVASFDAAMAAEGRRFTAGEAVEAVRRELGSVSAREVEAALRRASPAAWAGGGRRPACVVPTAVEIAAAAEQAAAEIRT